MNELKNQNEYDEMEHDGVRVSNNKPIYDPSYLEQQRTQAARQRQMDCEVREYFNRLHYIYLQPLSPDEYYDSLKDKSKMKPYKEPKKRDAEKEAGLPWFSKLWLYVRVHFSSKAKSELETKEKLAAEIHERNKKNKLDRYEEEAKRFEENRKQKNDAVERLHEDMRQGNVYEIVNYFTSALQNDKYSLPDNKHSTYPFYTQFNIGVHNVEYDPGKKQLCYAYRIPNEDEILTFSKHVYDAESNSIRPIDELDEKHRLNQRIRVMHSILLRSLRMVYESDAYGFLDDVKITGFLEYYDPSYGTMRHKSVAKFHMNRDAYTQTAFDSVDVEALFSDRLKPKESTDLYTKKATEISEIND